MELISRLKAETSVFFKQVRAFAISLGTSAIAVIAANGQMNLGLSPKIISMLGVLIAMCVAIAGTAQLNTAPDIDDLAKANAEAEAEAQKEAEIQARIDAAVADIKRQSEEEAKRAKDEEIEELKAKHEAEIAEMQAKIETAKATPSTASIPLSDHTKVDNGDNKDNVHQPIIDNTNEDPPTGGSGVITNQN